MTLKKVEQEVTWDGETFVKGDSSGQQIIDAEIVKQIHQRLGHLCSDKWVSFSYHLK